MKNEHIGRNLFSFPGGVDPHPQKKKTKKKVTLWASQDKPFFFFLFLATISFNLSYIAPLFLIKAPLNTSLIQTQPSCAPHEDFDIPHQLGCRIRFYSLLGNLRIIILSRPIAISPTFPPWLLLHKYLTGSSFWSSGLS